jgi:hypothetical protein
MHNKIAIDRHEKKREINCALCRDIVIEGGKIDPKLEYGL